MVFGVRMLLQLFSLLAAIDFAAGQNVHPPVPLLQAAITQAAAAIRTHAPDADLRFPLLTLAEPTKDELQQFTTGATVPRRAAVVALERRSHQSYEATVDLLEKKLLKWKLLKGVPISTDGGTDFFGDALEWPSCRQPTPDFCSPPPASLPATLHTMVPEAPPVKRAD